MPFRRHHRNKNFLTVLVLALALAALWWGFGFSRRTPQEGPAEFRDPDNPPLRDERGEPPEPAPGNFGETKQGASPTAFQYAVLEGVEKNAAGLLPDVSGKEGIVRVWFASEREVYIEYRRSGQTTVDRMAFIVASGDGANLASTRQALYGLSNSGWELLDGSEVLFSKPQRDLYERDASGNWTKGN